MTGLNPVSAELLPLMGRQDWKVSGAQIGSFAGVSRVRQEDHDRCVSARRGFQSTAELCRYGSGKEKRWL